MANYNESQVSGSEYTRCSQVVISNPLNQTPQVQFYEQSVAVLGSKTLSNNIGGIQIPFNPATEIALIDPTTLQPTGQTATMGQIYVMLFSAYLQTAQARDAGGNAGIMQI